MVAVQDLGLDYVSFLFPRHFGYFLNNHQSTQKDLFIFFTQLGYGDLNKCEVQSLSTKPGICPRLGPLDRRCSPLVEGTCFPPALGFWSQHWGRSGRRSLHIHSLCVLSLVTPSLQFIPEAQNLGALQTSLISEGFPEKYHFRNSPGHVLSTKEIYLTQRDRGQGKETETEDRESGRTGREEGRGRDKGPPVDGEDTDRAQSSL